MSKSGQLIRDPKTGRFVKGASGGPGRPKGSKNVITLQKLMLEEALRASLSDEMAKVVEKVVEAALEGDRAAQKLVWDSVMSKQAITEDKSSGNKQEIKVKTMHVHKEVIEGESTLIEENDE